MPPLGAVSSRPVNPAELAIAKALYGPDGAVVSQLTEQEKAGFGPFNPFTPALSQGTSPRALQYPVGFNTQIGSIGTEDGRGLSFSAKRALKRLCPELTTAIEYRKKQFRSRRLQWIARGSAGKKTAKPDAAQVKAAEEFWSYPNRIDGLRLSGFLNSALEEIFTTDGLVFYVWRSRAGEPYALRQIDPATIKLLIDELGTVEGYQQVLWGRATTQHDPVTLERGDLLYLTYNPKVDSLYGNSVIDEIEPIITLAIRRLMTQVSWYTEGNVPTAFLEAPDSISTPDQLAALQLYFDEKLSGDDSERHKLRIIPKGSNYKDAKPFQFSKDEHEAVLTVISVYTGCPRSQFVAQVNRACYSADTETLTENGWKRFPDIAEDERIATFNPETEAIEYHVPLSRHVYEHSGEMVRFHTQAADVLVTPEHKMWIRHSGVDSYQKEAAEDVPKNQFYFRAAASFDASEVDTFSLDANGRSKDVTFPMDDWLEFLGYFISEGGLSHRPKHYLLTLAQKAGPKAEKIQALLDRVPFKSTAYPNLDEGIQRWNVYGKQVCVWLMNEVGGRCQNKRIPRQFMNLGPRQLRILFDALMLGDGTVDVRANRTAMAYYTTSRGLADDVQELAFKLGYSAAVTTHYPASGNRQEAYRVLMCDRKEFSIVNGKRARTPNSVTREAYDGYVYCFEVPNHLFITRRNGKIGIHGNTAESNANEAVDSGQKPLENWMKEWMDDFTWSVLGLEDVECQWAGESSAATKDQADADAVLVGAGILTADEVRAERGYDPIPPPQEKPHEKPAGVPPTALPAGDGDQNNETSGAGAAPDTGDGAGAEKPRRLPDQSERASGRPGLSRTATALEAAQAELAQWRRFALKPERVKRGRWADPFETRHIPRTVAEAIAAKLKRCETGSAARAAFEHLTRDFAEGIVRSGLDIMDDLNRAADPPTRQRAVEAKFAPLVVERGEAIGKRTRELLRGAKSPEEVRHRLRQNLDVFIDDGLVSILAAAQLQAHADGLTEGQ